MSWGLDGFAENGFACVEGAVGPLRCKKLLEEVVGAHYTATASSVRKPELRLHTTCQLSRLVRDTMLLVVEHGWELLSGFLSDEQQLVELSSLTTFPGAKAQDLHHDHAGRDPDSKRCVSVFVNLVDTGGGNGALRVCPGTHRPDAKRADDCGPEDAVALELPRGSVTFMNGALVHGAGANTTADRIRPVFYFTFGAPGLHEQSNLRPEVRQRQLTLGRFEPREGSRRLGWTRDSKPRLLPKRHLARSLRDPNTLMLLDDGVLWETLRLGGEQAWLHTLLDAVARAPGERSLGELARELELDPERTLEAAGLLAGSGWVVW